MSMTVMEFCIKHGACAEGTKWALSTGEPDMDSLWQRDAIKAEWRIWIATQPDVLSDRELRLFACWCCRQVWHLLTDERSRQLVVVNELYADGRASSDELAAAKNDARVAYDAIWASIYDAPRLATGSVGVVAYNAAWVVLRAADCDVTRAAYGASWAVLRAVANAAAAAAGADGAAVRSAARAAARDAQTAYLKEHTHPNFC